MCGPQVSRVVKGATAFRPWKGINARASNCHNKLFNGAAATQPRGIVLASELSILDAGGTVNINFHSKQKNF